MKRVLFVAFAALVAAFSAYATVCYEYTSNTARGWFPSASAACADYVSTLPGDYGAQMTSASETVCYWVANNYPQWGTSAQTILRRETACAPVNPCLAVQGQTQKLNLTLCYSGKDPTDPTAVCDYDESGARATGPLSMPQTVCTGGCVATVGDFVEGFYSRQPTSSGLYRISADMELTLTSTQCTATEADNKRLDNTRAAPPTCDGQFGYINGRAACIPKDASPSPKPPAGAGEKPHTEGNPTASSPNGGSDRIPATNGDGGNRGGPPDPRDGTIVTPTGTRLEGTTSTPSGTRSAVAGEEQLACGAPGQPPCRIDESGTPTGAGALSGAESALTGFETDAKAVIESHKSLTFPQWTWTFQLPTGCTNFTMGGAFNNLVLDVCQFQPYIHAGMAIVWIIATVFFSLAIIRRTVA